MNRYAHVVDGEVINVILWSGESPYSVSTGALELLEEGSEVGIGWKQESGEWIAPPVRPQTPPESEE
jgi:hypothetical protein